jgi:single-strand DNA-binding protein
MRGVNKAILIGNLGHPPEVKTMPSGTTLTKFSLATNRSYTPKGGSKVEETTWHNIIAWGKVGEIIGQYAKKGDPIYIEGRISTRKYRVDGETKDRFMTEIVCEEFQFLGAGTEEKGQQTTHTEASAGMQHIREQVGRTAAPVPPRMPPREQRSDNAKREPATPSPAGAPAHKVDPQVTGTTKGQHKQGRDMMEGYERDRY